MSASEARDPGVIRALHLGQPALNEAYRRMIFSFATLNRDDHVKNFSFLMAGEGRWQLAPAYDLTYAAHRAGRGSRA